MIVPLLRFWAASLVNSCQRPRACDFDDQIVQCVMNTGFCIPASTVRVVPPKINSPSRQWP